MLKETIHKEIRETIATPKMIVSFVVILLVMIVNGLIFSIQYNRKMSTYNQIKIENENGLRESTSSLFDLLFYQQKLIKPPSSLAFITEAEGKNLPNGMQINYFDEQSPEFYKVKNHYFSAFQSIDWIFVLTYIISFICLAFSYNAFSGEKVKGTLKLILSNPMSRGTLILGKLTGLLICIVVPLVIGFLFNLLIIIINPNLIMTASDLATVGLFFLLAVFFIIINLLLGFLISTLTSRPIHSLNLLLIVWILLAIIIPGASWVFARNWIDVPSEANVRGQINEEVRAITRNEKYTLRWNSDWAGQPPNDFVRRRAAGKQAGNHHSLEKWHQYLQKRMNQTNLAIKLSKISPFGVFRFLGERLSDNGYHGYLRFYEQVRRYRNTFIDFAFQKDQEDMDSHHLIWYENWSSRTFTSQKPVTFEEIPQFKYQPPTLREFWNSCQMDILILVFWCLILFTGTFVAFIRYDVR